MKIFFTVLLSILLAQTAGAESKFAAVFAKTAESKDRIDSEMGELRWLSHVVPNDESKPRQADYVTLAGAVVDGKYQAYDMSVISETWTIDKEGNWRIDQWILKINVNTGKLSEIFHKELIEAQDRRIIDIIPIPTKEASSLESIAVWELLLNKWHGWLTGPAQLLSPESQLAIGQSIDCKVSHDSAYGYILTRTGADTSSLISYGPTWKDTPEKAIKGTYFETKDAPVLMMASGQTHTSKDSGIYFDMSINTSGKDDQFHRDGEGIIYVASAVLDEKGEIADLMGMPIRLECGGKKVKKQPKAYCTRPKFGQSQCGVIMI